MFEAYSIKYCLHYLNTIGSLVTFREVFFVNKVHRKPESYGAGM